MVEGAVAEVGEGGAVEREPAPDHDRGGQHQGQPLPVGELQRGCRPVSGCRFDHGRLVAGLADLGDQLGRGDPLGVRHPGPLRGEVDPVGDAVHAIENKDYCIDILTQSLSIQKSLGSLNKPLVDNHLQTHVTEMFEAGGEARETAIAELLKVFKLNNNRG
jgi:DNA-binding FrmR family transcriptional regulator